MTSPTASQPEGQDRDPLLADALARDWYHTIELAPGVATSGAVDLREAAPKVLPTDLSGLRGLDVGTFDGFWAFEMDRRGAEVVATDLDSFDAGDWPLTKRDRLARQAGESRPGERFGLAAAAIGSSARRVGVSVYDLDPDALGGRFSYATVGDLLLHLRDPVGALESVRSVLEPGGRLLLVEEVSVPLTLLRPRTACASFQALSTDFNWWVANLRCLRDWLSLAGFEQPRRKAIFRMKAVPTQRRWHVGLEATTP